SREHRLRNARTDRSEERRGLRPGLVDLLAGIGVPDDAAADPEVDAPFGDRERADRQREVEVAVRPDRAEGAHRGSPADRLQPGHALRTRALDRHRPDTPATAAEEELRRG